MRHTSAADCLHKTILGHAISFQRNSRSIQVRERPFKTNERFDQSDALHGVQVVTVSSEHRMRYSVDGEDNVTCNSIRVFICFLF